MDPAALKAIKAHTETILQNSIQEALTSLRKELVDQREVQRNELATLQQQLTDLQKEQPTYRAENTQPPMIQSHPKQEYENESRPNKDFIILNKAQVDHGG